MKARPDNGLAFLFAIDKQNYFNLISKMENLITMYHEVHTEEKAVVWYNYKTNKCECSWCNGNNKLSYGLNIPEDKSWNSWWIIKYWNNRYIAWTFSFLQYLD